MDVYGKIWNERRMVIRERVLEEVPPGAELEDETLQAMIDRTITELFPDEYIRLEEKRKLRHMVFNSIRRMDVLQDVLEDETITEIMVNGPHHIFVEQAGRLYETGLTFEHQTRLENIVQQIASRGNRIVNESNPILDARLEDGSRVNIVVPPIALEGPVITIRKFPKETMTMEKLLSLGALTKESCEFLQKLVIAKYNIFISGGTGAGKTTFLNVLSNFIPKEERVITIEDSAELQIQNIANLVRLEARNRNVEGKNEVTIRDLVKSALRMRPDRIIVGEIRDSAAIDLLTAMNTGHDGSLSTGHANSPKDMLKRTIIGCTTSVTGAFPASSGGDIAFPLIIATAAEKPLLKKTRPNAARNAAVQTCIRMSTFLTHGSPRACGRSPLSAGRIKPPS